METFIPDVDILNNIKKYRQSLSYDDQFDIDIETKIMNLSEKGKARFNINLRAQERRNLRYKINVNNGVNNNNQ